MAALPTPRGPEADPEVYERSVLALDAARRGGGEVEFESLARLSLPELAKALQSDRQKLAFWLNVYNAGIQRELRRDPEAYRKRMRFFGTRGVNVAGRRLSFNAIEHGLLRRSQFGYLLGYVANPLPGRFERRFRLARRDYRVHFALNCGARSCPPLAAYHPETVDAALDSATREYLESEARYDAARNVVSVPRLFLWFRGDFGGRGGFVAILHKYGIVPEGAEPRIRYNDYDWTLALDGR